MEMTVKEVQSLCFSPTHTTQRSVEALSGALAAKLGVPYAAQELTLPHERAQARAYSAEMLVVVGAPVYGGRLPNVFVEAMEQVQGNGALAVAVVTYGNRAYEDALLELQRLLEGAGFRVVAGCASLGEHSMTARVAAGRPDEQDLAAAREYGERIAEKLAAGDTGTPKLPGNEPFRAWSAGPSVYPETSDACVHCGLCASVCPMGIIDPADPAAEAEGCIRCCACVKGCPVGARAFTQPPLLAVIEKLETFCTARREPELYL